MRAEQIHLEADEKVLMRVRKHWFILFSQVFALALAALFPAIGTVLLLFATPFDLTTLIAPLPMPALIALYSIWLLIIWMALFNVWTNYYLDVWTITNKRLIAIDQRGLFNRSTGSFRLERLQDMNVQVSGILATLLNFGTLEAQTAAGSEEEFRADGLPDPRGLKALILKSADELMESHPRDSLGTDSV